MHNALLYRRVSTDDQDNSLQLQEFGNDEYARRMGLTIISQYADADISGSTPFLERPGGRALLNRAQLGGIQHIVTSKQDRLGRDTIDTIATVRALWEAGITPHFTAEGGALPRTSQNQLLFEIKASVANYELNIIRERTTTILRHKARLGELTGTIPYGWDCSYTYGDGHVEVRAVALSPTDLAVAAAAHGGILTKLVVPNDTEQHWLRQIADWRGYRGPGLPLRHPHLSLKAIADRLNTAGVPSKTGGRWQCGNVDGLLKARRTQQLLSNVQTSTQQEPPADQQQAA